jgi:type VI secretion system secreted protein VgrG
VASPWAGTNFGGIAIPRIGQEVIIDFENGDPDRPIIIGRVYNQLNMPPWELPGNQTQSGVLTRSSEGGGPANANALRFEDLKGQEEVWLHAEKDQRIEVENDESHWVGHDRKKTIDHDETNHIKNDRTETVDGHEKITVHKTRVEEVDLDETVTVHMNQNLTVHKNRTRTVDGHEKEHIGKTKKETIALAHMQNIGLGKMVNIGAAYSINVGGLMSTVVGAVRQDTTAMNHSVKVGKSYTLEAGDVVELKVGKSVLRMDKAGKVTITGTEFLFDSSGPVQINGKDIDLN